MAILEVQHIEKHFGATKVLEDISFSLEKGQALSIIGSSGSGKTNFLLPGRRCFQSSSLWWESLTDRTAWCLLLHRPHSIQ